MDRYVLEFDKITDVITSEDSVCELFKLNEDHWLKVRLNQSDHIFYHVTEKGLLDFLSGRVNMAGLFNNAPGNECFLYIRNKGLKVRDKYTFDYREIYCWNKFYNDFTSSEVTEFDHFIKDIMNNTKVKRVKK